MIKKNKGKLLVTSLVIILPIAVGLLLWDRLPQRLATHWGLDGTADGWSGKAFAVFALPMLLLVFHWLCVILTTADPKNKAQSQKAIGLVFWIFPVLSLVTGAVVYTAALGVDLGIDTVFLAATGLIFVVVGNYFPKYKHNYTLGIRVKWALESEDNWNATHRFGGKVWVAGGLLMMLSVFLLPKAAVPIVFVVLLTLMAVIPTVYSYLYYRRQKATGTLTVTDPLTKGQKWTIRVVLIITLMITLGCVYLLFSGDIGIRYGDTAFTIEAAYYRGLSVDYADIETIEYREGEPAGTRTNGFGSPRLQMGSFRNDEYGPYTRYAYTRCPSCVVLTVKGETLVLSGTDEESTMEIYRRLLEKTEGRG